MSAQAPDLRSGLTLPGIYADWTDDDDASAFDLPIQSYAEHSIFGNRLVYIDASVGVGQTMFALDLAGMKSRVRDAELAAGERILEGFTDTLDARVVSVYAALDPELEVVVVVPELDLDFELELRATFRRLAAAAGYPATGDLYVVDAETLAANPESLGSLRPAR